MFFFFLVARLLSLIIAFLYPGYETFKTLAYRPGYENQSARWMMYWAVIALLAAYEYSVEFLISWFPLYHEVKTLFLLFLVLPQTQGSTLIYQKFILPFLLQHEALIDQQLGSLQGRFFKVAQDQFQNVLQKVFGWQAAQAAANVQEGPRGIQGLGGAGAPARPGMPAGAPSGIIPEGYGVGPDGSVPAGVQDLWRQYGPSVMATGAALLQGQGAPQPQSQPQPRPTAGSRSSSQGTSKSARPKGASRGSQGGNPPPFVPQY
ncbi:hypothetical protein FRC01_006138 [Tulasnella sp. 417]|nr:hypothetical protein FRC01_006138 [Tulasnella sp. 417]